MDDIDTSSGNASTKPFRCKIGLHKWVKRTNDEGGRYLQCVHCDKEDNIPDSAGPRIIG